MSDDNTRKREFRTIREACKELHCSKDSIIVLNNETEKVQIDDITLEAITAFEWLTD